MDQQKYFNTVEALRKKNRRVANALVSAGGSDGVVELSNRYTLSELKKALTVAKKFPQARGRMGTQKSFLERAIKRSLKK